MLNRIIGCLSALLILFVAQHELGAQSEPGPSQKGLQLHVPTLKKVDTLLERAVTDGKLVGCNALIFHSGKEAYYGQFGQQDARQDTPIRRNTIFRIYSMSKPITSVAAMQLVEKGLLKLDEPVDTYLKPLGDLKVAKIESKQIAKELPLERRMLVRDLLRHTSGLTYGFFANTPVDNLYKQKGILFRDRDIAEMVNKLGEIPLKTQPGTKFEYSISTDVLGRVIEVASGQSLDRYLKENIFSPLEMHDTSFVVPEDKLDRFAEMYREARGKLVPSPAMSSARFVNPDNKFFSGGGGLCSTIDDYLKFCQMLIHEGRAGNATILRPETLEEMFTNQLQSIQNPPSGFRFGLGFRISPGKLGEDYSWGGIAGTRFWVNPKQKLIVLFMTQVNPYGQRNYGRQIRKISYEALIR